MKRTTVDLSEHELKLAVVKIAVLLVGLVLLVAAIGVLAFGLDDPVSSIVLNALLISFALNLLINGFLGVLKIIDWFELRRANRA